MAISTINQNGLNAPLSLTAPVISTITNTGTLTLPTGTGTLLSTANPQSGGVIQVVNATTATAASTSGTTFIDSNLTATITPKFASSKILVLVSQNGITKNPGASGAGLKLQLVRNSTVLTRIQGYGGYTESSSYNWIGGVSSSYLDSPATTSATTYKTQFANENAVASVSINSDLSTSTITLLEIAA